MRARTRAKNEIHAVLMRRLKGKPPVSDLFGVNVICAAEFMTAIGDIRRFRTSRQLAAYLGLDPKVRQSGDQPARSGRISSKDRRPRGGRRSSRVCGCARCCWLAPNLVG